MRKSVKPEVRESDGGSAPLWMQSDGRVFQASNTFVHACMDATMAMHALTAKIKELEKYIRQMRKASAKPAAATKAKAPAKPRVASVAKKQPR